MMQEDDPETDREREEENKENSQATTKERITPGPERGIQKIDEVKEDFGLVDAFDLTDTPEELLQQIQKQAVKMNKPVFEEAIKKIQGMLKEEK